MTQPHRTGVFDTSGTGPQLSANEGVVLANNSIQVFDTSFALVETPDEDESNVS